MIIYTEVDASIVQSGVAIASLVVASITLLATIVAACLAGVIARNQTKKEERNYLLFSFATPYNVIETDILLLMQGTYDTSLIKDELDKEALMAISKAKSYSIMKSNKELFDYMDRILNGKETPNLGKLIDDYFIERNKITLPKSSTKKLPLFIDSIDVSKDGVDLNQILQRTRIERDETIKNIKSKA